MKKTLLSIFVISALTLSVACGSSDAVKEISIAIAAVDAALPILNQGGVIGTPTALAVEKYLTDASNAYAAVSAELQTTDSAAAKAAKVSALLAPIAVADVAGLSPQDQVRINSIVSATQVLINAFGQVHAAAFAPRATVVSKSDAKQFAALQKRAEADAALLARK